MSNLMRKILLSIVLILLTFQCYSQGIGSTSREIVNNSKEYCNNYNVRHWSESYNDWVTRTFLNGQPSNVVINGRMLIICDDVLTEYGFKGGICTELSIYVTKNELNFVLETIRHLGFKGEGGDKGRFVRGSRSYTNTNLKYDILVHPAGVFQEYLYKISMYIPEQ